MNQNGSSLVILLGMVAVVVGTTIFSTMNNSNLDLRIAQKSLAKTRFKFLMSSVESAILDDCTGVLAPPNALGTPQPGETIGVDVDANGIDFLIPLAHGCLGT